MSNINLKTNILIDNTSFDFEVIQIDNGIITAFKLNNRVFRSIEKKPSHVIDYSDKTSEMISPKKTGEIISKTISQMKQKRDGRLQKLYDHVKQKIIENQHEYFIAETIAQYTKEFYKNNYDHNMSQSGAEGYASIIIHKAMQEKILLRIPKIKGEKYRYKVMLIPLQPDSKPEKQLQNISEDDLKLLKKTHISTQIPDKKKTFQWTKEKDKIICDNFNEMGVSGIYDQSLLPGFTLTEIRSRCQELKLIDQYGNIVDERGGVRR